MDIVQRNPRLPILSKMKLILAFQTQNKKIEVYLVAHFDDNVNIATPGIPESKITASLDMNLQTICQKHHFFQLKKQN